LQKSHVNIVADFSMASQNSNMAFQNFNMAFQNFNMAFQNSEHGVSKLRTWRFKTHKIFPCQHAIFTDHIRFSHVNMRFFSQHGILKKSHVNMEHLFLMASPEKMATPWLTDA